MSNVDRFVDSLIEDAPPTPFRPTDEEAELMRAAVELRAARIADEAPSDDIFERLRHEIGRPAKLHTRRRVVQTAGIAAASLAAGVGVDRVVASSSSPPEAKGTWQTVVASGDLPDGGVHEFDLDTVAGFVQRTPDGLRAVSSTCTHLGCRLQLQVKELVCPCHNAIFALSGDIVHYDLPIDLPPLPHFEVREQGGVVQILAPDRKD
jgi:nitrite reductase/ring-hydroxylating ferredoxin subunit